MPHQGMTAATWQTIAAPSVIPASNWGTTFSPTVIWQDTTSNATYSSASGVLDAALNQ